MTQSNRQTSATADREMSLSRVFDAPRPLVWKAWTQPEHLIHWWGPRGFTNTFHEYDFRVGGTWRFIMHGPDGVDYGNKIVFTEISEPERITYDHGEDDDKPALFGGLITFEDLEDKTEVTLTMIFGSPEQREAMLRDVGAVEGGNQTLDRLGDYLKTM